MGIKGLKKILKKHCKEGIEEIKVKDLKNKTIAIDTSIFLYKYTYNGNMLECFIQQLHHLLKFNITPVYLFDGKPTEDKRDCINKRKETFKKANDTIEKLKEEKIELEGKIEEVKKNNPDNLHEIFLQLQILEQTIQKKERGNIKIDWSKIKIFKQILEECGLFYYQCNGETDIYVKEFFKDELIDYVITEDVDFLTHGCEKVLFDYNFRSSTVILYKQKKIIEELELTQSKFIDMCILMGCDYTSTISKIGTITAYKLMKKHLSIEEILEEIKTNKKYQKYSPKEDFDHIKARNMFICQTDINISKKQMKIIKKNEYNCLRGILHSEKVNQKHTENLVKSLGKTKKIKKTKNIMMFLKKK